MKTWYDEATMVKFRDPDWVPDCDSYDAETEADRPMMSGFCVHDVFVCACCGYTVNLSYYADLDLKEFEELKWIDINEAVIGE